LAEQPWQNSLGMKFVTVPGTQVLICIWDSRVEDYSAFFDATGNDTTGGMWSLGQDGWKQLGATWKEPGFSQGTAHPVVGVSWYRCNGVLRMVDNTRAPFWGVPRWRLLQLPTDQEWSIAVGLGSESGTTPKERDSKEPFHIVAAIVVPSIQSPSGFGRGLRVLPAGCDARPATLDCPAMDDQFTAPDDCAIDN
jgi:hypothetical protein